MSDRDPTSEDSGEDEGAFLAAEHALGVLDGRLRRHAERRMGRDAAFAAEVGRWDERFAPLLSSVAPVAPPPALWDAIAADLERMTRTARAGRPAKAPTPGRRVSALWQWFGLGAGGLAVASLAALFLMPPGASPSVSAPLAAALAGENGGTLYTAVVFPGASGATLIPVLAGADPVHSHELWRIAPGAAPKSLGVLKQAGPLRIEIAPELLANGRVLAISLEPVGGSPTGQPTGPVVAKGELQAV